MSDEPSPPPEPRLRLKPRPEKPGDAPAPLEPPVAPPKVASPPVSPPAPVAPPADAGASGPAPGKIKLRMRMPIKPAGDEAAPEGAAGAAPPLSPPGEVRPAGNIPVPIDPAAPPPVPAPKIESAPPAPAISAVAPTIVEAPESGPEKVRLRVRPPDKAAPGEMPAEPPLPALPSMPPLLSKIDLPPAGGNTGAKEGTAPPLVASAKVESPAPSRPESAAGPAAASAADAGAASVRLSTNPPIKAAAAGGPTESALPPLPPLPAKIEMRLAEELPRPKVPPAPTAAGASLPPIPGDRALSGTASAPPIGSREGVDQNIHLKLKSGAIVPAEAPAAPGNARAAAAEKKPAGPRRDSVGIFVRVTSILLVVGVAYLVYRRYMQMPHPEIPAAVKPASAPAAGQPAREPQSTLGRAVQKTRETVAQAENNTAAANEAIESSSGPAPASAGRPAPRLVPSPQFRALIDRLKISGFRAGPPPRLVIGGVTYLPGDVINDSLGVVFFAVDPKTGELVFKDSVGAELRRHL